MADVRLDDDRLAIVLASIGEHLVVDGVAAAAPAPSETRPRWRPLLVAASTLAVDRRRRGRHRAGPTGRERMAPHRPHRTRGRSADRLDRLAVVHRRGSADRAVGGRRPPRPADAGRRRRARSAPRRTGGRSPKAACVVGWPDGETSLWVTSTAGGDELVDKIVAAESDVTELPTSATVAPPSRQPRAADPASPCGRRRRGHLGRRRPHLAPRGHGRARRPRRRRQPARRLTTPTT